MTMQDLFRSRRSRRSLGLPHTSRRLCLAALFLLAASSLLGAESCTPPESMKAKLQDKPNAAVFNDLGVWFADKEQYACAANAFATSLQMEPEQPDAAHVAFMFGVSLYFSGDTREAIAALQQAEQLGSNDIKIHTILATALDSTHETASAATEWRAALAFDPESSTVLDSLSNDLLLANDFKGTVEVLETPRLLGQRTEQQSANLATAYTKTGKPDEAARVLRDALNIAPVSLPLVHQLAAILVQLGRLEETATALELALSHHPDDALTHEALGVVLARLKQMAGAKEHLERAIALGDNTPAVKENLARVLAALGAEK
jgi:Flp pilus assembly protein TadD